MSSNGKTGRGNPAPPAQSTTNGTRGGGPPRRPNHNPSTSSASHSPSKGVKRKKSGDNQVRQQMLDTALARALFATAVPFSKFDHPLWSKFFSLLNYVPPTPDDLRNSLLEREYKQCQTKNETSIGEADRLGIMAGYFSNVRLDSAVNIIVTTPQPVLWKQKIYLGNRGKDLIGDELLSAINKLGPQKFWLLVTNYEDGYAADKVVEKYPHITQVKCASQCWDLLVGDLIQSVPEMAVRFQEAKEIVKHFKFCSERLAVFKENQAEIYLKSEITTLKRSGVISWAQSVTMLLSVIKNEDALKNSAKTAPDIDKSIKDSVLDERFWKDIKCFSEILSRIHAAITYIAGEQAGLSDVYHIHMLINEWVKSNLTKLGLGEKAEKVDTVLTESLGNLIHPIHLAAYLLDKRYEGMALDVKGVEQAEECIQNLRNHPGLVEIQEEEKKGRIAEIIIAMPPSAAECSRRRWEHAFIHSKARNRLTNDRAAMLVQIRGTLRADLQAKKRSARTPMTVQQLEEYFAKYPENTDADAETDSDDGEQQAVLPRLVRQAKIYEYFQSRAPSTSRASSD